MSCQQDTIVIGDQSTYRNLRSTHMYIHVKRDPNTSKETCLVYILPNYDKFVKRNLYTSTENVTYVKRDLYTSKKSPGKEPYLLSRAPELKNCDTLQNTATNCRTLQNTATHCNTLQHTATITATTGYNFWKPQHQMSQNTEKH